MEAVACPSTRFHYLRISASTQPHRRRRMPLIMDPELGEPGRHGSGTLAH